MENFTKKRLFELMYEINDDLKLFENDNHTNQDEFLRIATRLGSDDDKLFTDIVNRGIDSHLEGFTKSKFETQDTSIGKRRIFNFHEDEIPILLRRLEEIGTDEALQWKNDIENYENNIQEIIKQLE